MMLGLKSGIKQRLILGFAIAPVIMIFLIIIGISRVNSIEKSLSTINNVNSVKQRYAINFRGSVHDRAISLRDVVLYSDPQKIETSIQEIEKLAQFYSESAGPLDKIFESGQVTSEELQLLKDIKEIEQKTLPLVVNTIQVKKSGQDAEALKLLMEEAKPAFITWLARINKFIDYQEKLNGVEAKSATGIASGFQKLMILLTGLSLSLAFVIGFFTIRSIVKPLENVASEIDQSSTQISSVSEVISGSSRSLADGASHQASSIEQISSAIEQMNSMVEKNADNSQSAAKIASESKTSAENGEKVVRGMIDAIDEINVSNQTIMDQINESNRQISEIVTVIAEIGNKTKVINDIVFQTKLLSFNASVEAARAGEHGKGFAVVAEEVGNLAQLSGNAAKEISDMLSSSSQKVESIVKDTNSKVTVLINEGKSKVETGTRIAHQCAEVLSGIVHQVTKVNGMANEISIASKEQTDGFRTIAQNITQMDQITQKNAGLASETANTLESLNAQSNEMRKAYSELSKLIGHEEETGKVRKAA